MNQNDFEISTYYMNGIYSIAIGQRYLFLICLVGVLICNGFYYNLQPVTNDYHKYTFCTMTW